MINLACSYREAGRAEEAVELGQPTLELCRRVFGPTHEDTLNAMTELATLVPGPPAEPRRPPHVEEASLRLKRQHLRAGHPGILESMENLANCFEESGRKPEAEALRRELAELKAKAEKPNPGAGQPNSPPAKP